jgi:hypothetical protein
MRASAANWAVPQAFYDPMFNYLVHGFAPGSFFTALLANDCMTALSCSHPSNTMEALKALGGWIRECFPRSAWGDYDRVILWQDIPELTRREILEQHGLIYSEADEINMALKGVSLYPEPVLY